VDVNWQGAVLHSSCRTVRCGAGSSSPSFSAGAAVELRRRFATAAPGAVAARTYDIDPNGNRIIGLVNPTQIESPSPELNRVEIALNWFTELQQRVPVK